MKHQQLFCPYWGSSAWHSRRVNERGKSRVSKTLYCRGECKALLWAPAPHNTCGSCWLGTARHFSHDMRGEGWSGVTLICVPVVAPGKRKTEENLIFHDNFIQCSTETFSFFVQHFCWNILIFVATACFVLPLSTLCCLLENSKCLWHWRWRRSESFALKVPQFKWSDLGEHDVVVQGSFGVVFMVFDGSG